MGFPSLLYTTLLSFFLFLSLAEAAPVAPNAETELKGKTSIKQLIVVGDSFSDNGNGTWLLTNKAWPANKHYYDGRFSNGPVWPDVVSSLLHIPLEDRAYGGSTSNNSVEKGFSGPNADIPVPDMVHQTSAYLKAHDGKIPKDALFVILTGANDMFYDEHLPAEKTVASIRRTLTTLEEHGARSVLLLSYPDLATLPYSRSSSVNSSTRASYHKYSTHLSSLLSTLSHTHPSSPSLSIHSLDLHPLFQAFASHPSHFGFSPNITVAEAQCLYGAYGGKKAYCGKGNEGKHVYWDEYHPSAKAHGWVARSVVREVLKGWPEK